MSQFLSCFLWTFFLNLVSDLTGFFFWDRQNRSNTACAHWGTALTLAAGVLFSSFENWHHFRCFKWENTFLNRITWVSYQQDWCIIVHQTNGRVFLITAEIRKNSASVLFPHKTYKNIFLFGEIPKIPAAVVSVPVHPENELTLEVAVSEHIWLLLQLWPVWFIPAPITAQLSQDSPAITRQAGDGLLLTNMLFFICFRTDLRTDRDSGCLNQILKKS